MRGSQCNVENKSQLRMVSIISFIFGRLNGCSDQQSWIRFHRSFDIGRADSAWGNWGRPPFMISLSIPPSWRIWEKGGERVKIWRKNHERWPCMHGYGFTHLQACACKSINIACIGLPEAIESQVFGKVEFRCHPPGRSFPAQRLGSQRRIGENR